MSVNENYTVHLIYMCRTLCHLDTVRIGIPSIIDELSIMGWVAFKHSQWMPHELCSCQVFAWIIMDLFIDRLKGYAKSFPNFTKISKLCSFFEMFFFSFYYHGNSDVRIGFRKREIDFKFKTKKFQPLFEFYVF